MDNVEFKPSTTYFILCLILDVCLIPFFGIGFILMVYHVASFISNKIILTQSNVIVKSGILSSHEREIQYRMINSITVKQGMIGKSFGWGDILIMAGNDTSGIPFTGIDNPQEVKKQISERIGNVASVPSQVNTPYDELERLAGLKDKGVITAEEFETKKKQLLQL